MSGEVERLLDAARRLGEHRPDIRAVALVGSWARGTSRPGSDVDLVVLANDPGRYVHDDDWIGELGALRIVRTVGRGAVTERRAVLPSGLEVDVGLADPSWAVTPADPGTARVAAGGLRVIHDPDGLFDALLRGT